MSAGLSNDEIEDKYFLQGHVEILSILNELAHRREPVSVYFNNGQQFILTILLSARDDGLVFDMGGDEKANALLAKAKSCTFLTYPDGIRVQFSGINPERFMWGDEAAFWVEIPKHVIRLQRRDSYRITLPISHPLSAQFFNHDHVLLHTWEVNNLSAGGFNVITDRHAKFKVGDRISEVHIQLDSKSFIKCATIVRHITPKDFSGSEKIIIGMSFVDLSHAMDIAIQRAITHIEYERHKLLGQ